MQLLFWIHRTALRHCYLQFTVQPSERILHCAQYLHLQRWMDWSFLQHGDLRPQLRH